MSELFRRILVAVPAAILFLFITWAGGIAFGIMVGLIALLVMVEMIRIFNRIHIQPVRVISIIIGMYIWTVPFLPLWLVVLPGISVLFITLWAVSQRERAPADRWLATLFCGVYAPAGLFLLYQIRTFEPESAGLWFTFAVILMIWGNDSFAYFGGRAFGKHPMAPQISPNKTWEGFLFGFLGSFGGLLLVYSIADPFPINFDMAAPMVLLVSLFGPFGDLIESRLKRLASLKDSSDLLPGHGGFFDRFDAFILCGPVVFVYLYIILL